jgi:hypothetical protein
MASVLPAMLAIQAKAIETRYNGYRFRSRTEARWAVFLDELGIKYVYEPEGFNLNGLWYLPDFEIPEWDCYIEIKPTWPPTRQELDKAIRLCMGTKKKVYILAGQPWPDEYTLTEFSFLLAPSPYAGAPVEKLQETYVFNPRVPYSSSLYYHLRSQNEVMMFKEVKGYELPFLVCTYNFNMSVMASTAEFVQCRKCQAISIVTGHDLEWPLYGACRKCESKWQYVFPSNKDAFKLFCGYYSARSARFEFGVRGRT